MKPQEQAYSVKGSGRDKGFVMCKLLSINYYCLEIVCLTKGLLICVTQGLLCILKSIPA